jgi:hypothetical protein
MPESCTDVERTPVFCIWEQAVTNKPFNEWKGNITNSDQCFKFSRKYKYGRLGKHKPLDKPEVGSGAEEENANLT